MAIKTSFLVYTLIGNFQISVFLYSNKLLCAKCISLCAKYIPLCAKCISISGKSISLCAKYNSSCAYNVYSFVMSLNTLLCIGETGESWNTG